MLRITVLLVIVTVASISCRAQNDIPQPGDTTKYWHVETKDDNEFIGKIMSIENGIMKLKTDKFGTVTIRVTDIKSVDEIDPKKIVGDQYWAPNFQSSRYFWMPNGYGVKKGEAYYQNVWILFNQFTVGLSDHFAVSAGTVPLFLFGAGVAPLWVNGKLSLPLSEKVHFGTGVLYASVLTFDGDNGGAGIAYGVMTFGSRDRNASFGMGYGFAKGNFARRPVLTFATMSRLGPRSYFMTENYLFFSGADGTSFGLLSLGGRRLIKKVGLDFGGFLPIQQDSFIVIPWLGLSVPLGKRYQ